MIHYDYSGLTISNLFCLYWWSETDGNNNSIMTSEGLYYHFHSEYIIMCTYEETIENLFRTSWEEYISSLCSFEMLIESLFYKNVMHHYALSSNIFCNGLFESHLASTETCESHTKFWILAPKTGQNCIYSEADQRPFGGQNSNLNFGAKNLAKLHIYSEADQRPSGGQNWN